AARSREAILAAAERLFSDHGFEATSIAEIAKAAGLSRGAPNYFFGSKSALYVAVLERVFAERQEATRAACEPLLDWASGNGGDHESLKSALHDAIAGYMQFLLDRPAFLKLMLREDLSEAEHLRASQRNSRAIEETFEAVSRVAPERGLGSFDVGDAV